MMSDEGLKALKELYAPHSQRTIANIDTLIIEKRRELLELKKKKKEYESNPIYEIAEILHKKFCHWSHTDGCAWFYEYSWEDATHKLYLQQAEKLVADSELDIPTIIKVISNL